MWHQFQTVSTVGWNRFKVSPQSDLPLLVEAMRTLFFFFFVQKFITRCSIAVRGRLSTTSSLHGPQEPDCPITGKRHYQYQRRNLT